jgi:hypothetical protein
VRSNRIAGRIADRRGWRSQTAVISVRRCVEGVSPAEGDATRLFPRGDHEIREVAATVIAHPQPDLAAVELTKLPYFKRDQQAMTLGFRQAPLCLSIVRS